MALCKLGCGANIGQGEWPKHVWSVHPEEAKANLTKALIVRHQNDPQPKKSQEKTTTPEAAPPKDSSIAVLNKVRVADKLDEAVSVFITPKAFQMSSSMLWVARAAAVREWNWPADITPEDFLDTYLYESFKQRGIVLGGYQVVQPPAGGNGNGDH